MKVKFYLLPLILFQFFQTAAQDCSTLAVSCTTNESRCVATGSITIHVTGGSGNYTYRAIGPVSPAATSSNVITGLPPGSYTIQVRDLNTGCIRQVNNVQVTGNYDDPRFQLIKTDASCAGNDGTISVINQQFGRAPFTYTIIAPSPSAVGTTNSFGAFSGLVPGEYSIQLQDSCGGIQVRKITIENYNWWFDSVSVVRNGCEWVDVFIRIRDNKGNVSTTPGSFAGFSYGYITNTNDTSWHASSEFSVLLGTKRNLTIVVKDNCGKVHSYNWSLPNNVKPSLGNVSISNLGCSTFTASVTGQNLTSPGFCLYDNNNNLVACNGTGTFTNVPYGSYCIRAVDVCYDTTIVRCFTRNQALPSVGASVQISNQNCSTFTATITGKQNLTNPQYCLYNASNVQIACNTSGVFSNVPYGTYCIRIEDGCVDTTISRCFTTVRPTPVLTGYTITGSTCNGFNVTTTGNNLINPLYCLFDNAGNVIACDSSGVFTGIPHGSYCVRAISCGDTTNSVCFTSARPIPLVGPGVSITNRKCSTYGVAIYGQQNLTNPQYCLYDANDSLLRCNTTGVFDSLAYGSYCIKIVNNCYDTVITRCFTENQLLPSINSTMQVLSRGCNTVSFQANGSRLTTPNFCLYDASGNLLACNTTGIFNNYPYGSYCVKVEDGCVDTTMTVCQTFAPVRGITLATSKACTIGKTNIDVSFANANSPYAVTVYHPDGSQVHSVTTSSNPLRIVLPALPAGTPYKVVCVDNCGNRDSATIVPDANIVTRNITVRGKCPSSLWLNGSGDIQATCSSNFHAVIPQIIKKNGSNFVRSYSSVTNGTYIFADLEPAEYIVEYTQQNCNSKVYDTVTVSPYVYPTQGQSAIYQCDNNSFSLGADVQGGVSPYSYQIIGSSPSSPDITTPLQASPVFNINTGTVYSLVRLRTLDACGNATLSDISVLPLQNISVTASDSCFFRNITLSVDTIPNAVYIWYRKTSATDSTLLDTSMTYNLPFFQPEQAGDYVCKVVVNDGCVTRLSYFRLDGDCNNSVLPLALELKGRKMGQTNQLYWHHADETGVIRYLVERKRPVDNGFTVIGTLPVQGGNYFFNDNHPGSGLNQYRVTVVYANRLEYTNLVNLKSGNNHITVYPNPVKDHLQLVFAAEQPTSYRIELIGAAGQLVYSREIKNITVARVPYQRPANVQPGIYLLRITDSGTGLTEIHKLMFE